MASSPNLRCFTDEPPIAADVARGVTGCFCRQDLFAICEMPLPNGRRADLMAIDSQGRPHHRRDQGREGRPARRRQVDRLSRIIATVSSGRFRRIWRTSWRRSAICRGCGPDRRRSLRRGGRPRGGASAAGARTPQGRAASFRAPRRAAACGADRSVARRL